MQKQREGPEIHRQHRDERRIETKCQSHIDNIDPIQIMQLRQMMDFAMRPRCSLKQTSKLEHFRVL